ncbi:oxygen sensor histidine kinase FixL [Burkholderia glumae]|uniref:histidine kinase n=1 Tax=Burkholderia glumae TaxID=337 RepID=A0AAP9Y7R3_BURGL|nr:oxygen sensor histidine kinase FixL [Burkholderia glumae]ACR29559.1 Sensory box histidine kinase [Burkholderia glumae BGR1]AJY65585.1 sensory box protein [Burkholderia glumae LMG 2196 = ATCC 33617]KHJ64532.1 ATPase [Burkholderia glumae]MCM2482776.1 oxygen sensor histidine kinase FixL [Burkholderia glumae]MCM2490574.1 oxygen sensor histidine kinase FixL [Burkholderia glumae]
MLTDRLFARSARASGASADSQPSRWHHGPWWSNSYLLTPLLSILVFLVVMSLILWSLNRREQQQQEDTLYRNVAWAQQQIRLSMTGAQEQLQAFARDVALGRIDERGFQAAAGDVMQAHPEILYLNWYVAPGTARWPDMQLPTLGQRLARPNDAQLAEIVRGAWRDAHESRRQAYSALAYDDFGNGFVTLQTPVTRDREYLGSIATVFSVEGILKHDIPPELSAKYKISITDVNNRELASTSSRPRLPRDAHYDLPLDPPGQGLTVRVYAYPQMTNLTNNTLVWLVAGLSCFVLWSLWSLWKHTRQRFEAQQALYAEAFFRRAMENSVLIGMRVLDMHGRITHVNPAFCRMTGWDEEDLVGKVAPFPYWPRDAYPEMQRQLDMTLRGKAPSSGFELRVRRKDASMFHARLYVSPLIDSSGRQTGWMSSMTDITEPKRAREELAAAHERFTTVLESLDAAVSVLAADEAELLFANRYYRHLFGIRPDGHLELSGGGFDSTQASSDSIDMVDAFAGLPATALTESTADAQEVYVESIQKWFEVRRQYIQWVDGHLAQMQIATDITTRKKAQELAHQQEEKLQFTSRLMTMGEMASSIAHELNQPLAAINNYCSGTVALVKSGRGTAETLLPALEKTAQQALRAGMIVKRIREFVKRSEPKRQAARVADIIADAVGLAEIEARKRRIRIVTEIRARMPIIYVDPVLIEQVLMNLMKNAAEAMGDVKDPQADGLIRVVADLEAGFVDIRVIDQGPGVDEASAERLFEPFYSTKSDGMGMGLNICRSIIESHRGRLWVVNNIEADGRVSGATFHCSLPIGAPENHGRGGVASHTVTGEI